ncbi:unnamed protein product [Linum tenue]|uniref:Transposase-associated domain-containing protein n=1 Tax=Linum tenue TaxID=586396 RepID=A0AAV0Q486_9ROSI|nr:unnamed protein product [Linum tenue]
MEGMEPIDKAWIQLKNRACTQYIAGMEKFAKYATDHVKDDDGLIRCPCVECGNVRRMTVNHVEGHLLYKGMRTDYTKWIYHGEVDEDEEDDDEGPELGDDNMEIDDGDDGDMGEDNDMDVDDMLGFLNDLMAPLANLEEPNAQAQNLDPEWDMVVETRPRNFYNVADVEEILEEQAYQEDEMTNGGRVIEDEDDDVNLNLRGMGYEEFL